MASVFRPRNIVKMMGRPPKEQPLGGSERAKKYRQKKLEKKLQHMAVLDFETDPFDNTKEEERIYPFAACLYSDNFEPKIIWNSDFPSFISELLAMLESLDGSYIIYAHNGGKFDWMFLVKYLTGKTLFKGRGIMAATIGKHEIRDSLHLIPEKLASYRKDDFNYNWLHKSKREKHKAAIIEYMTNDCRYLHDIVKSFLTEFGFRISIGQAAMAKLKEFYIVKNIGENTDRELRGFFYGGRVECLQGRGLYHSQDGETPYKMYDVNSMYPNVMATMKHPISNSYTWRVRGGIKPNTVFLDLTCSNRGALIKRNADNETTARIKHGRFMTTIYEFRAAQELKLIDHIKIHQYIDNAELSDFSLFVLPIYERRQIVKASMDEMLKQYAESVLEKMREFLELKKESIFLKLLLNNAYGKFAQNPRRYKESYIAEPGQPAPEGFEGLPAFSCPDYDIWERPTPHLRFNNVGTAASITGAARSMLLRAIHKSQDAIYCDTDSLICRQLDMEIHPSKLGAWKFEKQFDEVIIAGKKQYATKQFANGDKKEIVKIKNKGVETDRLGWADMLKLLNGETLKIKAKGPTLTKRGEQYYMEREIKATAPLLQGENTSKKETENASFRNTDFQRISA